MKPRMYSIELIREYSDDVLYDILAVYHSALPTSWHYPGAASYFGKQLHNKNTIQLLLRRDGRPVGYLLAIPHNDAVCDMELKLADPYLIEDPNRLYVEEMEVLPEFTRSLAGGKLCLMMLSTFIEEAGTRGIHKFSMHARVTTGLNQALRKIYGDMLTLFRRVDKFSFYNYEEPTEYIEGDVSTPK